MHTQYNIKLRHIGYVLDASVRVRSSRVPFPSQSGLRRASRGTTRGSNGGARARDASTLAYASTARVQADVVGRPFGRLGRDWLARARSVGANTTEPIGARRYDALARLERCFRTLASGNISGCTFGFRRHDAKRRSRVSARMLYFRSVSIRREREREISRGSIDSQLRRRDDPSSVSRP